MLLVLGAALVALHSPPSVQADTSPSDAYLDPTARVLVERARQRRQQVESGIEAYQVLGRQRVYAGMRVVGRNRTMYTREMAARVHWRRHGPSQVAVVGAREVSPVAQRNAQVPEDVLGGGSDVVDLAFNPDRLQVNFGFGNSSRRDSTRTTRTPRDSARGASMRTTRDSAGRREVSAELTIIDPFRAGSESHYRFATGDSVTMRFQDGRVIQLRELRLIPRRADYRLLRGSVWLDSETYGVVRGVFAMARPFNLSRDADEDMPAVLNAMGAVTGQMERMTLEFGLVQGKWWLPVRTYMDATAQVGILGSFPVRFEQSYSGYRVQGRGEAALPELVLAAGDSMATAEHCEDGDCRSWQVLAPRDSAALLTAEELQPSLAQAGEVMATDRELEDLGRVLQRAANIGMDPAPRLDLPDLSMFRYNRVEGFSVGSEASVGAGPVMLDAKGRVGTGDWEPSAELGINRGTIRSQMRLVGYRRLVPFDLYAGEPTFGSALNALVLGRDETDYFRASGVELTSRPVRASRWELSWRLFGEHQHPVQRETDVTLTRAWDDDPFLGVRPAERADQAGAVVTLRSATDNPYGGMRRELSLTLDGQAGDFQFARPSVSSGVQLPVGASLDLSMSAAAGTSFGEVPLQGLWYIGGPTSVRGFRTAHSGGESFWRARAEISRGAPAFRLALFSDAGWTGDRDSFELDPTLLSAGAGLSIMDGILRLDLAKGLRGGNDWRADLYVTTTF